MLIPQLYGEPFARVLGREFSIAERVDIAVAWVRASGVGLVWHALTGFLRRGGALRIIVGIDRDNTSVEGLSMLLDLQGDVGVWVRHNEAGGIFHPKLYAFRSVDECRVILGSNNLTGAGLATNEELSGLIAESRGGSLERSLTKLLRELADTSDGLARRLDTDLLRSLQDRGYIGLEARLRGKSAALRAARPVTERLFGARALPRIRTAADVPLPGVIEPDFRGSDADWRRVFIRPRLARRTQAQLPVTVARAVRRRLGERDVDGPIEAILRNSNAVRMISPTYPTRGNGAGANTYKFESFEARGNVVVKLELIGRRVLVEQYDTADPAGRAVDEFIAAGMAIEPPQTHATLKLGADETYEEAVRRCGLYRYD